MADETTEGRVNVLNSFGRVVSIPASQHEAALASGDYRPASAKQVEQAHAEIEHGGPLGMAEAAGYGAARTLTLGASDVLATELGGEEQRRRMALLREVNPMATLGGELAGGVAMGALLPGAGAVGGMGGRVGGAALRGAYEGAAFGAGMTVSESALENRELTGEALVAGIGYGAALGGGIGGALGLGGHALRAGRDRLASAIQRPGAEGVERLALGAGASEGASGWIGRKWAGASDKAGVAGVEAAESAGLFTSAAKRKIATQADRIVADETETVVRHVTDMFDTIRTSGDEFVGVAKREQLGRVISRETSEAAITATRAEVSIIREEIEAMTKAGRGEFGRQGNVKKVRDYAAAAERKLAKTTDPLDAMMMLDDLKRDVGKMTTRSAGKRAHSLNAAERATRSKFDGMYERLRGTKRRSMGRCR
jgi:hypothetical protein